MEQGSAARYVDDAVVYNAADAVVYSVVPRGRTGNSPVIQDSCLVPVTAAPAQTTSRPESSPTVSVAVTPRSCMTVPYDLQSLLLRMAGCHTVFAVLSTLQWATVGTTYAAMGFSIWEWLSGFVIFWAGSTRTTLASMDCGRNASLGRAGQCIIITFAVMAAIAAFLAFGMFWNGVYSVVKVLSPEITTFILDHTDDFDYRSITIWLVLIGVLNILLGILAVPLHVYFTIRFRSILA